MSEQPGPQPIPPDYPGSIAPPAVPTGRAISAPRKSGRQHAAVRQRPLPPPGWKALFADLLGTEDVEGRFRAIASSDDVMQLDTQAGTIHFSAQAFEAIRSALGGMASLKDWMLQIGETAGLIKSLPFLPRWEGRADWYLYQIAPVIANVSHVFTLLIHLAQPAAEAEEKRPSVWVVACHHRQMRP